MAAHEPPEVDPYLLGVLVDEMRAALLRQPALVGLGGLHDERDEVVFGADGRQELVSRRLVYPPAARETAVADDSQRVLLETGIQVPSLLVGAGEHDFRTSAHAQGLKLRVQGFGGELQALLEHETVEVGQYGRVETDGVLHQQYHLHAGFHVVFQVHLVFYQLDDGEEQVGVAQPAEHVVEDGEVHVLHALPDAVAERGKHDDGNGGIVRLYAQRDVEHVAVVRARHADNQVEDVPLQLLLRFLARGRLEEAGRIAQAELHVLVENLLFHPAVVLQHEGVVRVRDEQHVENAPFHQVHEVGVPQERAFLVLVVSHNGFSSR